MKTKSSSYKLSIGGILLLVCLVNALDSFAQNVGIGSVAFTPLNMLDVKGNMVIGSGYSGVNTAPTNGLLIQGNTGIGTTSPTEMLHVTGNIRFSGALMPNNSAGTSGQVLTSQGAGVSPVWSTVSSSGTVVYTTSQTGSLSLTYTSTSFTQIPGLTYTLVLSAAAKVMIMTQGGLYSSSYGSIADVGIFINGNSPTSGGLQRVCVTNYGASLTFDLSNLFEQWNMCVIESLAAGSYTITVQARSGWNNSRNYSMTVGSTALSFSSAQTTTTDVNTRDQGILHVITF